MVRVVRLAAALAFFVVAAISAGCDDQDDKGAEITALPAASGTAVATAETRAAPRPFPETSYMAELQRKGEIVIGVKYDVQGMGRLNPVRNTVEGFDVYIGREITRVIFGDESKVRFVEANPVNRLSLLQDDRADLVIAMMAITPARRAEIDFSDAYYRAGQSLLVTRDSAIAGVDDLAGKRVCVTQGSISEERIRELAPQAELLLLHTYADCLAALQSNRADAVTADDVILAGLATQDRNTKLVGGIFTEEEYGIGVKKGRPEFVEFVNAVLDEMIKSGRWQQSYDRWLGGPSGVPAAEALQRLRG